ncbi:MAG: YfiT family bacillithiol transferase [Thermoanaerobaculia bacterium]
MTDARYPIGPFETPTAPATPEIRLAFIEQLDEAPGRLRAAVKGMTELQLDTPYRAGGWTVRQLVHHVPDSHINAYTRFKLALTEQNPDIKTYEEDRWANLPDVRSVPVETSLTLLEALHGRWVALLQALDADDFTRTFQHPESGAFTIDRALAMYAWHGRHHVAHVTTLKTLRGWC